MLLLWHSFSLIPSLRFDRYYEYSEVAGQPGFLSYMYSLVQNLFQRGETISYKQYILVNYSLGEWLRFVEPAVEDERRTTSLFERDGWMLQRWNLVFLARAAGQQLSSVEQSAVSQLSLINCSPF